MKRGSSLQKLSRRDDRRSAVVGREKEIGSIENLADLVILNANPLEDIRNVRRIYRVVKGGVVYDPAIR